MPRVIPSGVEESHADLCNGQRSLDKLGMTRGKAKNGWTYFIRGVAKVGRLLLFCGVLSLLFLLFAHPAQALAPHEVLLLVNANSPHSKEVANHFINVRQIPVRNVVYLSLPDKVLAPRSEITPDEFTRYIWAPTQAIIAERELDHVLAWIYSVDFPTQIRERPSLSIQGLTFLRNQIPEDRDQIDKAGYLSPLFAGPDTAGGARNPGASLRHYAGHLGDTMPLPSMMLGFIGARGNRLEEVLGSLRRGQAADRSHPRGTVYLVTGTDVRATTREWQFEDLREELTPRNVRVNIVDHDARNLTGIIGLQMGLADVNVLAMGRHLPGSMAEHLTSHAATFHLPIQTKLSDWIAAGATATAGTVVEPYALWPKFPHARFYAHYANGHSMLESFFLSLRSPLQILLVGEPLARPWAPRINCTLIPLHDEPVRGEAAFMAALFPELPLQALVFDVLIDGKPVASQVGANQFAFDTDELSDGWHELRVVVSHRQIITHAITTSAGMIVRNRDRAVSVSKPEQGDELSYFNTATLAFKAEGAPERIELIHNRQIIETSTDTEGVFTLDPETIGGGPVTLHARAWYADEPGPVLSPPLVLTIVRDQPPPALQAVFARSTLSADTPRLAPTSDNPIVMKLDESDTPVRAVSARFTLPGNRAIHPSNGRMGWAFNIDSDDHFDFFVFHGEPSAWTYGTRRDGQWNTVWQRGAPVRMTEPQDISLLFSGDRVRAYVNNALLTEWTHSGSAPPTTYAPLAERNPVDVENIQTLNHQPSTINH